ncbi:MAG TPA: DHA2 family efflux MFS transporter permease subunit [Ktedonobacteraceae bacterium]|jgi:DHA2 family multidrug resistance protein|nr:DHA2 family efflux MFS transporter permease subunit [Ktedonobacteraceae bacterium]
MQVSASAQRQESGGIPYKWIVAIVVVFGIFMTILDGTIVNIAIPRLQSAFGASLNDVQWVLTGYTLAQGIVTPMTAFFADRVGIKRFYMFALAAFTIGSALCGLAVNLPMLIFFRVLQGMGGAFMTPLAITLLYREFPPAERGTAMGFLGIPILLAPAFGPTLGGYLVTFTGWQLIFYINVPIGILGFILAGIFLREARSEGNLRFDIPGFIFSAAGLGLLLYGLSSASTDGWGSSTVLGCLIAGALLLATFVIIELNIANRGGRPLLDVRVFGNGMFSVSNFAMALVTFALYGGLFVVPIYLQNLRGLSAYQAGLILLPQAFASMIAVLVGGRLVDKLGVRAVTIPGLLIMAFAFWRLSYLNLTIPYGQFQILLILRGFGLGLCAQPLTVSALSQIKPRMLSQATSVNTTIRFVVSSIAIAILSTLIQTQTKVHYVHLAETVTPSSALGQFMYRMQGLFMGGGQSASQAWASTVGYVYQQLQLQAYMLSIQDTFWISVGVGLLAIVATFFVYTPKSKEGIDMQDTQEIPLTDEERQARDEAMIAV